MAIKLIRLKGTQKIVLIVKYSRGGKKYRNIHSFLKAFNDNYTRFLKVAMK